MLMADTGPGDLSVGSVCGFLMSLGADGRRPYATTATNHTMKYTVKRIKVIINPVPPFWFESRPRANYGVACLRT